MNALLVYQFSILSLIGVMAGVLVVNLITVRSLGWYMSRENKIAGSWPRVTICVPARNEIANIAECLRSLLAQEYTGDFTVLALDDDSDDGTGAIITEIAASDGRLRLLQGAPLPAGWLGKNWACHQLAEAADGDLLLFTDADTRHAPRTLASAVAALRWEHTDLVSVFPSQLMFTFAERMTIPLTFFYVFAFLPNFMVRRSPRPAFSAANGQFMLYSRAAYAAIGGHAAFRAVVLEDVKMAMAVKRAGFATLLPDGSDMVRTRMYRSASEVWRGFSKNVFAFFDFHLLPCLIFLVANALMYIGPYFFVGVALLTQIWSVAIFWLPLAHILLGICLRIGIALRFNQRITDALFHSISILFLLAIAANAIRWHYTARATWKGRNIAL